MDAEDGPQLIVGVPRRELLEFAWPVFERKMKKDAETLDQKCPVRRYCKAIGALATNDTCPVCLTPFRANKHVRITPCKHMYCDGCLTRHVHGNRQDCPMCRTSVISSSGMTVYLADLDSIA